MYLIKETSVTGPWAILDKKISAKLNADWKYQTGHRTKALNALGCPNEKRPNPSKSVVLGQPLGIHPRTHKYRPPLTLEFSSYGGGTFLDMGRLGFLASPWAPWAAVVLKPQNACVPPDSWLSVSQSCDKHCLLRTSCLLQVYAAGSASSATWTLTPDRRLLSGDWLRTLLPGCSQDL